MSFLKQYFSENKMYIFNVKNIEQIRCFHYNFTLKKIFFINTSNFLLHLEEPQRTFAMVQTFISLTV